MKYTLPPAVREILNTMSVGGFTCYLVGGCVRDLLMSCSPYDYDFVSDRRPSEIITAAEKAGWKVYTHGVLWGVVNVIIEGKSYEIATMRSESYGVDPHRPKEVTFLKNIFDDLSRRDFTINAIAMDGSGKIIDPFGGWDDLENKVIRSVGNARERFLEDPLRLLRAARFAARTGFEVHHQIMTASKDEEVRGRFQALSVERVRDELERILLSQMPSKGFKILVKSEVLGLSCTKKSAGRREKVPFLPEVARLYDVEQNPRFHRYDVLDHTLQVVESVEPTKTLRWAALLHDIAKGADGVRCYNRKGEIADYGHAHHGADDARVILERLRAEGVVCQRVPWLIRHHMDLNFDADREAVRWARKCAKEFSDRQKFLEAVYELIQLSYADDKARGMSGIDNSFLPEMAAILLKVLEKLVLYPEELKVSGEFIAKKMGHGPQVGKVLQDLLIDVQSGRLQNSPQELQAAVLKKAWRKTRQESNI